MIGLTPMLIYDENNEPWFTAAGDPADGIAKGLERRGFRRIVLPVETIRTGAIPEPNILALEAIARALDPLVIDATHPLFVRRCVMEECCRAARHVVGLVKEEADGTEGASEEETD